MRPRNVLSLLGVVTALVACGTSSRESGFKQEQTQPTLPKGDDSVLGDGKNKPTHSVSLAGTVMAPNGSLPMANTLVYVTSTEPAPIPEGVYCDTCVTLDEGTFAVSSSEGAFEINTELPAGDAWVVVQKGQFRRVRKVTVEKPGEIEVPDEAFTLPGKSAPSKGDDVPKMVVLKDMMDYDKIDESLHKLGIKDFEIKNDRSLLDDEAELMKYQVVFIPCGSQTDPRSTSETSKANIQKFVAAGGKLYVTDYSYEFVRQPFPGFVTWERESSALGSAASGGEWDAPAAAADPGLGDWLSATGDSSFEVKGNWTTIKSVNVMPGTDPKGDPIDIEPKVWVTAQKGTQTYPTTISFENQCGRVLFSTYHTESSFGGTTTLLAQEKSLLYVLLEVGVCIGSHDGVE